MKKHRAIAPWSTFEEGCQDAARQALQVVCAENRRGLEHTEYYIYLTIRVLAYSSRLMRLNQQRIQW